MDRLSLEQLTQQHPERIRWAPKWSDYRLLYRGGDDFLRSAGQLVNTRITSTLQTQIANAVTPQAFAGMRNRRFLYQLEGEPDPQFFAIWNRAYYINYLSAILDYFRHWLFSQDPVIRPTEDEDPPDWWATFCPDATGSGKSFTDFVRDVFLDVLVCRRAGWLIGRNTSIGEQGKEDDAVVLTPYPAEQIYDWERDSTGKLLWVVLSTRQTLRQFPDARVMVETFTYCDKSEWQTYEVRRGQQYQEASKQDGGNTKAIYEDDDLQLIGQGTHGLSRVPFVMMEIPEGLWIADKLAQPCVDIFNKQVRLTNAQLMGCIMQPYIQTSEDRQSAQARILGENILLHLRAGDSMGGGAEDFGWKSPDTKPLEFISAQLDKQRDEIYRIVHQMSLAVDSKAVGAIARSGASKIEDRKASEIILAAYGGYVSAAMLETVNLLGEIYGDKTEWTLDGYRNFNTSTLDEEVQITALAQALNFKSTTAKQELELKVVGRLLDHVSEPTKEKIESETRDAYEQEAEQQLMPLAIPVAAPGMGQPQAGQPAVPTVEGEQAKPYGEIKSMKKLGDKENAKSAYGQ